MSCIKIMQIIPMVLSMRNIRLLIAQSQPLLLDTYNIILRLYLPPISRAYDCELIPLLRAIRSKPLSAHNIDLDARSNAHNFLSCARAPPHYMQNKLDDSTVAPFEICPPDKIRCFPCGLCAYNCAVPPAHCSRKPTLRAEVPSTGVSCLHPDQLGP